MRQFSCVNGAKRARMPNRHSEVIGLEISTSTSTKESRVASVRLLTDGHY
jgi:hypothetical protein